MTDFRSPRTAGPDEYWFGDKPPSALGLRPGIRLGRFLSRRWRVEVSGREQIPLTGPVILAANHMAILDGPILIAVAPRPVHALVKHELFAGPMRAVLNAVGQIPVDRDVVDVRAVRRSLAVLAAGRALAIYPEGSRGRGDLAVVKRGAAYLAMCTGTPIIPVACLGTRSLEGTIEALPAKGQRVAISFGAPLVFEKTPWPRTRDAVGAATERLAVALRENLNETIQRTGIDLPELTE